MDWVRIRARLFALLRASFQPRRYVSIIIVIPNGVAVRNLLFAVREVMRAAQVK